MWSQKSATMLGMTAPLMALAIPLLDTGLAIARRLLRGQPIFGADRGHIHHRLLDQGLTPRRVALILYLMCGIGAILSLLQNTMGHQFGGLILILFCGAAWLGIQHLGYIEFDLARRLALPNTFRRVLNAQLRLRALEDSLNGAQTADECWTAIRGAAADLGFNEVMMKVGHLVYQERLGTVNPRDCWTLDVPLSDSEFVRIGHSTVSDVQPMVAGSFAALLHRSLGAKLAAVRNSAWYVPASVSDQLVS
jgi:UDP-GlcNAc:undecaprenyl-phosphate GlcNAc-1-phosphate transferase